MRVSWRRAVSALVGSACVGWIVGYAVGQQKLQAEAKGTVVAKKPMVRRKLDVDEEEELKDAASDTTDEGRIREAEEASVRWSNAQAQTAVWLDCDPGHDDCLAILLAVHSEELHLLGISTVQANQTLDRTTYNARSVLEACGAADVPVVAGCARPFLRHSKICAEVHGETGLDGAELPAPRVPALKGNYAQVMYRAISAQHRARGGREKVQLVCTAPMTNVAVLFMAYPDVVSMVEVVFMGGTMGVGNTGPVAEFNIQVDPEAAKLIMQAGCKVTMVPLEVTHTALVSPDIVRRIESPPSQLRAAMRDLMLFFRKSYEEMWGFESPPLHDPCAVAYVLRPDLFTTRSCAVEVETTNGWSLGQTIVDVHDQFPDRPKNVNVAFSMDVSSFWDLMLAAMARADTLSPMNRVA
uniref:Inosine/uridine-preferring nucleoside hydrolase domain-containing protein n=1 Tax=Picocystis salinarum TaxID=88271 RepID=A0A6U9QLX3_9CHLO|mmetsp:Transcript_7601/g.46854  ORF Transcript_7601/g.46854 Transcript_7601/m.46854 type:complete len:411 (-) Transcript_7601:182-1414(-)